MSELVVMAHSAHQHIHSRQHEDISSGTGHLKDLLTLDTWMHNMFLAAIHILLCSGQPPYNVKSLSCFHTVLVLKCKRVSFVYIIHWIKINILKYRPKELKLKKFKI